MKRTCKILLAILLAAGLLCAFASVSAEAVPDGLYCIDGTWQLYTGGQFAGGFTGLYCDPALGWWLVGNGNVCNWYTGLWCDPVYGWWLIGNGTVCFDYNGVWDDPNFGPWIIEGGRPTAPASVSFPDGLHDDGNGWHLYLNGAVASGYTGLYGDANVGWWLVNGGTVDFGYTGLYCDANYGWWLVGGGAVCFDYNGLWGDPVYGWWLVNGGTVNSGYTGLYCDPNFGWWLIGGGAVCFDYNGVWNDPVFGSWVISGGQPVSPAGAFEDGLHDDGAGWHLYQGGTVASGYTGLYCDAAVGWWLVRNGAVDFGYEGLYDDAAVGCWLVRGGAIDFGYTGYWNEIGVGQFYVIGGCLSEGGVDMPEGTEDFGGQTLFIYDWWSSDDANHSGREADPDEITRKQYEHDDQVEAANNVKIVRTAMEGAEWGDMSRIVTEATETGTPGQLNMYIVDANFTGDLVSNGLLEPWDINLSGEQWLSSVSDLMTVGGKVYGVMAGVEEPREVIFFNKQVLADAGIDYNEIYQLAATGQWTWDKFEQYMQKTARDTDNDGVNDVWALTGNGDRLTRACVFSNNGSFFDTNEDGKMVITADSEETLKGIAQRQDWNRYMVDRDQVEASDNWNWFEDYWKEGTTAFYIGQAYEGPSKDSLMNTSGFDWGVVPFPKGPDAEDYLYGAIGNVAVIPVNCYDGETVAKIENLYAQYTAPAAGTDPVEQAMSTFTFPDSSSEANYAAMYDSGHALANKALLLGDENTVLGETLFWNLDAGTPSEIVEAAREVWQFRCDVFNKVKTRADLENYLETR